MRIAFVSDIHANLQAWNAVKADIAALNVDKTICLGDITGYGPSPAEVLTNLHSSVHHFVLGNHDAVVGGLMSASCFNRYARRMIDITRSNLDEQAVKIFKETPLSIRHKNFRCSHGGPAEPKDFSYVLKRKDAEPQWDQTEEDLLFIGHTHVPRLHVLSPEGKYRRIKPGRRSMPLQPGYRYIINCGSVGVSRDDDFRACYAVYDSEKRMIQWQRVAYDLEAYRAAVRETYQEKDLARYLLKKFDGADEKPVRALLDFRPGTSSLSESVVDERELEKLAGRLVRWKIALAAAATLLVVAAAGFAAFWKSLPRPATLTSPESKVVTARPGRQPFEHQFLPVESSGQGGPPPGWKIKLGDARQQTVTVASSLICSSETRGKTLEIYLPKVILDGSDKIRVEIEGQRSEGFAGETPVVVFDFLYADRAPERGARTCPVVVEGQSVTKQHTISDIPRSVRSVQVWIRARFKGMLTLDSIKLTAFPGATRLLTASAPLDINRTSWEQFRRLPGIGETLARRITAHRDRVGEFSAIDDLLEVEGIGPATLQELREYLRVETQ
ncbi:MAG: helix-hairpin-helix domain-containing protein [Candidatus Brocadiia bacterium]